MWGSPGSEAVSQVGNALSALPCLPLPLKEQLEPPQPPLPTTPLGATSCKTKDARFIVKNLSFLVIIIRLLIYAPLSRN